MRSSSDLARDLRLLEGKGYRAYRELRGNYRFPDFQLAVDHVQGDPFAAPSRLTTILDTDAAGFPPGFSDTPIRRVALADYLTRMFESSIQRICRGRRGSGHSGRFSIQKAGQEVLERNSVLIAPDRLEARFTAGLPAAGRRILGIQAEEMLCRELPELIRSALFYRSLAADKLLHHLQVVEDQQALRGQLRAKGLVAFVANGSVLPRKSGVDDGPLVGTPKTPVVPFHSPPELEVDLTGPSGEPVPGMGIPEGITLIVGGGFHGKTTLLKALERGVYDHIPGDGRERVVSVGSAVKIRAEDGRYVEKVDISPFINHLPRNRATHAFSTENASGSTSQAASISEALEVGSRLLLIDEDTSATNFILRDARMQALVEKPDEPITPFIDRVREIFREQGTSTIMVMGGSGDYFDVSDRILMLRQYRTIEVTARAREIAERIPTRRRAETDLDFDPTPSRHPDPRSFDPSRGKREIQIDSRGLHALVFGSTAIDLGAVEQLVDPSQTAAIGWAIHYFATRCAPGGSSLREGLARLEALLEEEGLDVLTPHRNGRLARPRVFEIAAAINRMRSLRVGCANPAAVPVGEKPA